MLYTSVSLFLKHPSFSLSVSPFSSFPFSQGSRLIALAARAAQLPPVPGVVYDAHQYQFLARYYEARESTVPITKRFPLRRWGFFKSYKFACDLVQQAARPGVFQEGEIMPVEDLSLSSSSSSSSGIGTASDPTGSDQLAGGGGSGSMTDSGGVYTPQHVETYTLPDYPDLSLPVVKGVSRDKKSKRWAVYYKNQRRYFYDKKECTSSSSSSSSLLTSTPTSSSLSNSHPSTSINVSSSSSSSVSPSIASSMSSSSLSSNTPPMSSLANGTGLGVVEAYESAVQLRRFQVQETELLHMYDESNVNATQGDDMGVLLPCYQAVLVSLLLNLERSVREGSIDFYLARAVGIRYESLVKKTEIKREKKKMKKKNKTPALSKERCDRDDHDEKKSLSCFGEKKEEEKKKTEVDRENDRVEKASEEKKENDEKEMRRDEKKRKKEEENENGVKKEEEKKTKENGAKIDTGKDSIDEGGEKKKKEEDDQNREKTIKVEEKEAGDEVNREKKIGERESKGKDLLSTDMLKKEEKDEEAEGREHDKEEVKEKENCPKQEIEEDRKVKEEEEEEKKTEKEGEEKNEEGNSKKDMTSEEEEDSEDEDEETSLLNKFRKRIADCISTHEVYVQSTVLAIELHEHLVIFQECIQKQIFPSSLSSHERVHLILLLLQLQLGSLRDLLIQTGFFKQIFIDAQKRKRKTLSTSSSSFSSSSSSHIDGGASAALPFSSAPAAIATST
ncbi:ap2 domain transcription factor ap2x-4 [Cystoisospora suis]|uniref:Ap2 domain transcription factor ap2x-4 n=1 Tax=Cystoisospora suis TaxID=483139 RepID=A0A2C6L810_9APIC|nr:ap2 domain transcription factor ap2x-4 [Cystoisospora suis]